EAEERAKAAATGIEAQQLELIKMECAGDFDLDRRINRPFAMYGAAKNAIEEFHRRRKRRHIRGFVPLHDFVNRGVEKLPVIDDIGHIGFVTDTDNRDKKSGAIEQPPASDPAESTGKKRALAASEGYVRQQGGKEDQRTIVKRRRLGV